MSRSAVRNRTTKETRIELSIELDGSGSTSVTTGLPFYDHMLDQLGRHGGFDLRIAADGDLHIDSHHTVEDVAIALGEAFREALGDKAGVRRYGHAYVPLDEALSRVVIDFSGRPGLTMDVPFSSGTIGTFDAQLTYEFFQGFVNHANIGVHVDNLRGRNTHHQIESIFKAFARALRTSQA